MKIKYQHIRYIPSAVRADKLNERTSIQNFRTQTLKGKFNEGMTGRGDNDTSAQSKVERDKTVATKDGGRGRSSRW